MGQSSQDYGQLLMHIYVSFFPLLYELENSTTISTDREPFSILSLYGVRNFKPNKNTVCRIHKCYNNKIIHQ